MKHPRTSVAWVVVKPEPFVEVEQEQTGEEKETKPLAGNRG